MSRLYPLTAILIVIFSSAIFMVERIGEHQPPPPFATLFNNPDGSPCQRPCLLGMQPGVTRFEEAFALTRNHPLSRAASLEESESNETVFVFADASIRLAIYKGSDGILNQSSLTLQGVTLGDVINLLGLPAWVNAGITTAYLYYPSDGVIIYIVNANRPQAFSLDISDPVDAIVIYPTSYPTFVTLPDFAKPWRGFTDASRYGD